MITKKKVMKKIATKKGARKKKSIETFYALMHKSDMSYIDKPGEIEDVYLQNCKSDNMNHAINSFAKHNSEDQLGNMLLVKIEVVGTPIVKTTREITIKK